MEPSGSGRGTTWPLGCYKVAKFYYWPGWHEPGTTGEVMVNLKAWEGLSEEHQAIIRAAVGAEAWQEFSDSMLTTPML
jgi:TRAP-type mannitol/chloroaromatic compound transport system substrate-binding protein